jgi:dimeric dUTPase (all-alpha-NTP-PPase superfamily)
LDSRYILGQINSRLNAFYYSYQNPERGEALAEVKKTFVEQFPVIPMDIHQRSDKARHDHMVELVERMLGLHKRLQTARTEHERGVLERQIAATDEEIDHLVYEVYELTDEEIAIVNGSTS